MSNLNPDQPVAPEEVPEPHVGARLRAAREGLGMDTAAVADSLKLSKRQIEALEAGDWSSLPGHTFIRGFVRNYARLLQVDPAPLLGSLAAPPRVTPQLGLPRGTSAVLPQAGQVQKRDYAAVLAGLVLVSVAVVAYYVVPPDFWQSSPEKTGTAASAERSVPLFPPSGAAAPETIAPSSATASPTASPAGPVSSESQATPSTAPGEPGKGLRMKFTQPSWVEVRDRSGQIIFSQLNPAGSEREVEGQPPFVMVVGNAAYVTVQYQGRNIELQPRSKDDVARVTVE